MVKRYYIFRHGETFVTKGESPFYGWQILSASILDECKPKLEKMAQYLTDIPTDFNASSQIRRCRQTVQIVSAVTGKQFIFDRRLNELILEPGWFFERRVKGFLNQLDKNGYENVLICTHGAVINLLIKLINPLALTKVTFSPYLPPCRVLILEKDTVEEVDFN